MKLALILLACAASCAAQGNPAAAAIVDGQAAQNKTMTRAHKQAQPPFDPPPAASGVTQEKYEEALREFYQYQITGLRHRQQVFHWQLVTSVVIFLAVLVLVAVGVYFSSVQFARSFKPPAAQGQPPAEAPVTQIKANWQGIEASSSVLGVIILVISLGFFYLYLVYVYPIQEIF